MGNVGRVVCVAIPFILATISLIALLVAGLTGVAGNSLYMFQVNTTDLQISSSSVADLIQSSLKRSVDAGVLETRDSGLHGPLRLASVARDGGSSDLHGIMHLSKAESSTDNSGKSLHDASAILAGSSSGSGSGSDDLKKAESSSTSSGNITASDLGLYDVYQIGVWGYCYTMANKTRECTKPEFNWAAKAINVTTGEINSLITSTGKKISLPSSVTDALSAFETVTRWTEIVFIIAYVSSGIQLVIGLFSSCSRAISCLTWLAALLTVVAVCAAAALATAMSVIIVGALEGTAKWYGVTSSLNTAFLALVWLGAAAAIAASIFWFATICCCKPERRSIRGKRGASGDRGMYNVPSGPGAYHPISAQETGYMSGAQQKEHDHEGPGYYHEKHHARQTDGSAYEPYSHANV